MRLEPLGLPPEPRDRRYNEAIQGGKVRINRIRLIQERFLEFWARLTHAAMIGISTVLSQESIAGAARRRA